MSAEYEPLNPSQAEERMRRIAWRLQEAVEEQSASGLHWASTKAEYNRIKQTALAESYATYGKEWPGPRHEANAEHRSADAYTEMVTAEAVDRSLREEMHGLRQILSSLQTNARIMSDLAR